MADLILNNPEMAEHAVEDCREKASRDMHDFESEGEFRGWIFRVLINEALRISTRHS
jgi:DNA-directed RNA polymerase specialized sigma24 family protein